MPRQCDVLIIGCGIAGATAAVTLAEKGLDVIVLSADEHCNSAWAQGGIVYEGTDDSAPLLAQDIFDAGAGLCNQAAVEQLVLLGPRLVKEFLIERAGVLFDRNPDGSLSLTEEAAHSVPRIIHHKDQTGLAIMSGLLQLAKKNSLEFRSSSIAIDLITLSQSGPPISTSLQPASERMSSTQKTKKLKPSLRKRPF
jgi:L-aspartate oxidase